MSPLLPAFVARLARHPDAEAFVLRGGMRVRELVPSARRPAADVDLVCRSDLAAAQRTVTELVAADPAFAPDTLRIGLRWRPGRPGLRATVTGARGGELAVDVTCGLPLWPDPVRSEVGTWGARAETVVGRKVQVLAALGRDRWRPKDLHDLALLLAHAPIGRTVLGPALEAAFDGEDGDLSDVREVFGHPQWWAGAEARWAAFAARRGLADPLAAVLGTVRGALTPVLR